MIAWSDAGRNLAVRCITPTMTASRPRPKTGISRRRTAPRACRRTGAEDGQADDGASPRGRLRAGSRLAQCLDRQHLRGPAGRDEGGDDGDAGADRERDPDRAGLDLQRA